MTFSRTLLSLGPPIRRRLSSVHNGIRSTNHCRLPASHATLLRPSQRRWNYQTTPDPAAGATAETVAQWYAIYGFEKTADYSEIKTEYYRRSKLYHSDVAKQMWSTAEELATAEVKWLQTQDIYERFTRIEADGRKAVFDEQIKKRKAQDTRAPTTTASTTTAPTTRAPTTRVQNPFWANAAALVAAARAKQAQKEKEDAIKRRALKRMEDEAKKYHKQHNKTIYNNKDAQSKKDYASAFKEKTSDMKGESRPPHAVDEAARPAGRKSPTQGNNPDDLQNPTKANVMTNAKTKTGRQDGVGSSQYTGKETDTAARTKAGTELHEQQTETSTKTARPVTKRMSATRRLGTSDRQSTRDADVHGRGRIVRFYTSSDRVDLCAICRALRPFKPGAIYASSLSNSVARIEFFHSAAARRMLGIVESGGMVFHVRTQDQTMFESIKITTAEIDLAADKIPNTQFFYRVLAFYPIAQESEWGRACQTPNTFLAMLRKHGVHSLRIVEWNVSPLVIWFASVKDAERVSTFLAKFRSEIEVEYHADYVGSIPAALNVGKLAKPPSRKREQFGSPKQREAALRSLYVVLAFITLFCYLCFGGETPELAKIYDSIKESSMKQQEEAKRKREERPALLYQ